MNAQKMWEYFNLTQNIDPECVDIWSFGADEESDALAQMVLQGEKTAMSTPYALFAAMDEPLPEPGDYNVILDSADEAVCIIKTTKVTVVPFDEVTEEHAYKEGENDRTLFSWRRSHRRAFSRALLDAEVPYDPDMKVVCEEFQRVYP